MPRVMQVFLCIRRGYYYLCVSDGILQVSVSDCKFFEILKWKIKQVFVYYLFTY